MYNEIRLDLNQYCLIFLINKHVCLCRVALKITKHLMDK